MQKKAIRIVSKVGYYDHTNPLFCNLRALKLKDLINLKTALVMYKAERNILPENVQKLFTKVRCTGVITRQNNSFKLPLVRTKKKSMCVSVIGVKLWNDLDKEIKLCKTICGFKKRYKWATIKRYECDN